MKTTIIIPNYNGMTYLKNCLQSLSDCVPNDFSVIVVDNGSDDGSRELLKEYGPSLETVYLDQNYGFAQAVNIGLKQVKTPYALLLNNDITVEPDFVKQMELAMERHPDCFSVNSRMLSMKNPEKIDGAGDLYCALGWAFAMGKGKNSEKACLKERKIFSACGGASIYRMDVLNQIGFLDENHFAYLEDVDLGYRAKIYGYRNYFTPDAVCYHAGSGFSGSRYNDFKVNLSSQNSIYLIYKNMPILQLILNLPFLLTGFLIKIIFFTLKGMGTVYLRGLGRGFKKSFSGEGRRKKIRFSFRHLKNYGKIQLELWWNMVQRIVN